MLKKFSVKNYKNFKDEICIDFEKTAGYQFSTDCITDGLISKMLIYGRNATGKTNLGNALIDIYNMMLFGLRISNEHTVLNADSSENTASFSYMFQFDDKELIYEYARLSNNDFQGEKLVIDGKTIFKCDFTNKEYEFNNLKDIDAETANIDRYIQSMDIGEEMEEVTESRLHFLRWLISNVALKEDSVLIRLYNYIREMVIISENNRFILRPRRMYDTFYEALEKREGLQDFEDFMNAMGIECKFVLRKLPDGRRELYFKHERLVPFLENASSGTIALIDLYRKIIFRLRNISFIYLDEFDAFYHYEMAENLIKFLKRKYPRCQVIMTSHNTNLMTNRLMRPDCLFILSGEGTLTALCDATQRELREGHNLEKMYISGEFVRYE